MKTKLLLLITLSIGLIANCSSSQKYELVKQKSNLNHVVLRNAQFFQDEKFALVNSDLIDLEKKAIVRSFKNTNALFLTKDNKTIIAPILNFSGQKEGGFEFYDVSTGKQIKRNTQEFFTSGALSQASITDNGKYLIGHKYSVEIYELKSLDLHPKSWVMTDDNTKRKFYRQDISIPLCPCRIFSDREFFAYYIYGKERKIVKVDIESGEFYPILNFKNGTELIQLSVSDDKRILAVVLKNSSLENELILFDTTTSKIQKSIFVKKWTDDASAKYFNIVFSPNNEQFIYGNKLYSTSDGTIIREFEYDMENPYFLKKKNEVVFSPILTNSNNMNALVQYMNLDTGKEIIEKRINQFSSQTSKIQYDKESKSFVVLNNTNSLRYDFRNNKVIKINAFVNAVTRYSPHNKKAFTLDEKGLHILDLNTLQTEIISDKLEQIIKILNETKSPLLDKTLGTPINSSDFIEHSDSLDGRYIVTYWRPWPGLKILKYFVWDMTNKSVYIGSFDNKIKSDELFWILGIHDNGDLIGAINSKLFTVNHKSFEITKTYNYQCRIWPTKIIFLDKDSFLSQGNALVIPSQPIIFHPLCNGLTPKILIFNFKENIITQAFTMPEKDSVFQLKRANDPSSIGGIGQNSYFLWDVKSGKIKKHFERVKDIMDFDSLGEMQLVLEADGSTELGNDSNNMKLSIVPTSNSDLLISNDKNQYMVVGKEGYNAFQFSKGLETYSFELFDISNNRPDIILNSLAELTNDESLKPRAAYYKKLWQIRVKQNGYSPEKLENQGEVHFPEAKITEKPESPTTTQKKISFSFRLKDDESTSLPIVGYKVFVNGVPIYGDYIRRVTPDGSVINNSSVTIQEKIDLSQGVNKIEVSGFTSDGHESPRDSFTINYNSTEQRVPDLYYIGIGVNAYDANKSGGLDALTYAVKDSQELKDTFEKSGKGKFANVYTKVLNDSEVTRENIGKLKDFLKNSQVDDQVIVFLSGHGIRKDTKVSDLIKAFGDTIPPQYKLRDGGDVDDVYYYMTSTANVDKPWENAIPLDGIRELVNGIPSRQKILLVDTCQSGEKLDLDDATVASLTKNIEIRKTRGQTAKTRGLNMVVKPGSNEKKEDTEKKIIQTIAKSNALKEMSELFPELRRGTGTIEISAATGAQSALESKEWQNGAFTFVIKEAILKGKAKDEKGNITARSLRKYVLDEVEKLTDGQQTPMVARDIAGRDFVIFGK